MKKIILLFWGLVGFQSPNAAPKKNLAYIIKARNENGEIEEVKIKKYVLHPFLKAFRIFNYIYKIRFFLVIIPIKLIYGIWPWQIYDDYLYIVK